MAATIAPAIAAAPPAGLRRGRLAACLALALLMHAAGFAALNLQRQWIEKAGMPARAPGAMNVRLVSADRPSPAPLPSSAHDERSSAKAVPPPAAEPRVQTETVADRLSGTDDPLGFVAITAPDAPFPPGLTRLPAWVRLDGQGQVIQVDVPALDAPYTPYVYALKEGLQQAQFPVPEAPASRTLCVQVIFAEQQPVRVESLGPAQTEKAWQRCVAKALASDQR